MPEVRRTFSISLDEADLNQIDAIAEVDNRSRNSLLEKWLKDRLKEELERVEK